MRDIRWFAPSYKRGNIKSSTQKYLPYCRLVVGESEKEQYEQSGNLVVSCPDNIQGNISRVRNWILDNNQDACAIIMLDDDYKMLYEWKPIEDQKWVSSEISPEHLEQISCNMVQMAEDCGVYLFGVNTVPDKQSFREFTPLNFLAFIGGPFQGHRPNKIRYDEALPLKEDYDMSLQHMWEHRRVLRFNRYHYVCKQKEQSGGCAAIRSIRKEKQQMEALRKKWGIDIIRYDSGKTGTHAKGRKKQLGYDINPIIKPPIRGV